MLRSRSAGNSLRRALQLWHSGQKPGCSFNPALAVEAGSNNQSKLAHSCFVLARQQLRKQHGWQDARGYTHFQSSRRSPADIVRRNGKLIAGAGGIVVVVWAASRQEIPYTHRKHAILVSQPLEKSLGESTFKQVIEKARKEGSLVPEGHPAQRRVAKIGRQIAAAASDGSGGGFQEHMKGLEWEYAVIDSPELNAFVVPGGKVVVYSKMLQLCRSDDELASILAHETAHVLARHTAERLTEQSWIGLLQMGAYLVLGFALPSDLFAFAFLLPHSRKQETEADMIGMDLAARACFDPAAGAKVFQRLGAIEKQMPGSSMPSLLRTHPLSESRVQAIQNHLPVAQQWAERSECGARRQAFFDIFSPLEHRLSIFDRSSTAAAAAAAAA